MGGGGFVWVWVFFSLGPGVLSGSMEVLSGSGFCPGPGGSSVQVRGHSVQVWGGGFCLSLGRVPSGSRGVPPSCMLG